MAIRDLCILRFTCKLSFCVIFIILNSYSFSFSKEAKDCSDYFYADNQATTKHPVFSKAYEQLKHAHKSQKKTDFDQYITLFKQASDTLKNQGCWEGYAYSMISLAVSYLYMQVFEEESEKARPFLLKVLQLNNSQLEANNALRGKAYSYLGQNYYENYQADSAIYFYNKSLSVYNHDIKNHGLVISISHFHLAQVFLHLKHNIERAEESFDSFLSIKNHPAYDPMKDINNYQAFYQLEGYTVFAEKYLMLGDYDKALSYAFKLKDSVHIYHRNQELQKMHSSQLLGTLYAKKGKHAAARNHFRQAERILDSSPTYFDPYKSERAKNILGLAQSLISMQEYEKAEASIKKGLAIIQDEPNPEPEVVQLKGEAYRKLGLISIKHKDWEKAKEYLAISTRTYSGLLVNVDHEIARNHLFIGQIQQELGKVSESFNQIALAEKLVLSKAKEVSQPIRQQTILDIYRAKGDILTVIARSSHKKESLYDSATVAYFNAISILRQNLYDLERESSLFEVKDASYTLFENALSSIWEAYTYNQNPIYLDKFSSVMEASKSLALLSRLGDFDSDMQNFGSYSSHEKKFRMNLSYYESELAKLNESETHFESKYSNISQRILEIEEQLKMFNSNKALEDNAQQKPSLWKIKQTGLLSKNLNNSSSHILSFYWGKKFIYTYFSRANGKQSIHRIPQSRQFEQDIYLLSRNLAKVNFTGQLTDEELALEYKQFTYLAHKIYLQLLSPIIGNLEHNDNSQKLLILPDGPLSLITYEVLLRKKAPDYYAGYKDLDYLLNHFTIFYSPSFSYLKREQKELKRKTKSGILAFSYSKSLSSSSLLDGSRKQIKRGSDLGELPGSFQELQSIANYFDGMFYMGSGARKDTFLKEAPLYNIIHLSLHGKAGANSPHLIFPPSNQNISNEEILYDYELKGLNLQAQLAILSACESGLGDYVSGEGLQGMAQSFLSSGCESVIMSLWEVDDKSTSEIMDNLYRNLSMDSDLDEALAESKRQYLKNSDPYNSHPSYWSSFILNGKNSPLNFPNRGDSKVLFLLVFLLAVISLGLIARTHPRFTTLSQR